MAWNEPGGQDPWGGRKKGNQGPPDLDELLRRLQQWLRRRFRGGGGPGGGGGIGWSGIGMMVMVLLAVWVLSGFYQVDSAQKAVVLRFGRYQTTTLPGLHWHAPWPVESVYRVDVNKIRRFNHQSLMLTADENIVNVNMTVQYRVAKARPYLFGVREPDTTLDEAAESAIREVIGKSTMDFALGKGRAAIAQRTRKLLQQTLDSYGTGLKVTSVNLQDIQPPEQVQGAFQDAIRAREDKDRLRLQAQGYANDLLPRARGEAARRIQEAKAYKSQVIDRAKGDASRFDQLLGAYRKAPKVTRRRIYIETMQDIFAKTPVVLLDTRGSGNMIYLPIDKLLEQRAAAKGSSGTSGGNGKATGSGSNAGSGNGKSGQGGSGSRARSTH
ncbi:MAG TPA: FtsH protease activity modulator HflK [Gammaproteobacteria bacterium]|nr:FtsH protease activity modulator HflK [Gammaproteobacteria bacterium]